VVGELQPVLAQRLLGREVACPELFQLTGFVSDREPVFVAKDEQQVRTMAQLAAGLERCGEGRLGMLLGNAGSGGRRTRGLNESPA